MNQKMVWIIGFVYINVEHFGILFFLRCTNWVNSICQRDCRHFYCVVPFLMLFLLLLLVVFMCWFRTQAAVHLLFHRWWNNCRSTFDDCDWLADTVAFYRLYLYSYVNPIHFMSCEHCCCCCRFSATALNFHLLLLIICVCVHETCVRASKRARAHWINLKCIFLWRAENARKNDRQHFNRLQSYTIRVISYIACYYSVYNKNLK